MILELLLGSDHSNPDTYKQYFTKTYDKNLAIAISVGGKAGCHPHLDLNEDSVGYAIYQDRYRIVVLTDAYNGSEAGEMIVNGLLNHIDELIRLLTPNFNKSAMIQAMIKLVFPISKQIEKKNKNRDKNNRTQMSIVVFDAKTSKVTWANFGDSRIYGTFRQNPQITPIRRYSLGYPMKEQDFRNAIVTGDLVLPSGEALLVCSDGFPETKYPEVTPENLIKWLNTYQTAEDALMNLMQTAIELEACDNLSAAIIINRE